MPDSNTKSTIYAKRMDNKTYIMTPRGAVVISAGSALRMGWALIKIGLSIKLNKRRHIGV